MAGLSFDSGPASPLLNLALTIPVQRRDAAVPMSPTLQILERRQTHDELTPEELAALPHDDYGFQLNFTIWLLCTLAFGFMALRMYCKWSRSRGLWWDDYVLITSWTMLAGAAAMTSVAVHFGYGKHLWDIPNLNIRPMIKVSNVAGCLYVLAALWSKTSFALTLLRITDGWMKKLIWFIIISMTLVMGASAVLVWVNVGIEMRVLFFISSTSYSGAMDIILALLPWRIVWSLVMSKKEKFGVAFAMSMGLFAGTTSLIKVSKVEGLRSVDSIGSVQLVIFGGAEAAITIIAASIPILRALIRDVQPKTPEFYHLDEWPQSGPKSRQGPAQSKEGSENWTRASRIGNAV